MPSVAAQGAGNALAGGIQKYELVAETRFTTRDVVGLAGQAFTDAGGRREV